MSALSAIGKRIDALFVTFDRYRTEIDASVPGDSVTADNLKKQLTLANSIAGDVTSLSDSLKPEIDKLVLKIDQKDPVTGAVRYGDASKSKILGFVARVDELVQKYTAIQSELAAHIATTQQKATNGIDLSASGSVVDAKLARMQAPALGPIRNIDIKFQNVSDASADVGNAEMSAEDRELEEKARLVRERKAQEAEHAKNVHDSLSEQLGLYISYFNSIRDHQLKSAAQKGTVSPLSAPISLLSSNVRICLVYLRRLYTDHISCPRTTNSGPEGSARGTHHCLGHPGKDNKQT